MLTLFDVLAAYGWAWVLVKSRAALPLRAALARVPVLGAMLGCVVCTGFWVGVAELVSGPPCTVRAAWLFLGALVACLWVMGRALGDVD